MSEPKTPSYEKRCLVTGGAGFIGSWLIRHLLHHYPAYHITNVDLLTYAGNPDNLTTVADCPNYRFVHGDIRDGDLARSALEGIDWVINVAAQTHVDRSITGPSIFTDTNVWGAQVFLEAARLAGVQKWIQISTDEVYGSLQPHEAPFTETSPLNPSSPYAASKAAADLLALSYFKTYGMHVCITRCSNNYGPNQYPEKLIPFFILRAMHGDSLPLYGDGLNVRDWIHVSDHSRAIDRVLHDGAAGAVYNIGATHELTNLEITHKILARLNLSETLITYVTDRLGHDRRYAIDSSKIQTELSWTPVVSFEQGLTDTLHWYQQNPAWRQGVLNRQPQLERTP